VTLAGCVLALSACGAGARTDEAADVATRFVSSLASGDTGAACDLLAPRTRESVESRAGSCVEGVTRIPARSDATEARSVQVWGDESQAKVGDDTLFLHRFPSGWKVIAAGCTPRVNQPYDCEVQA
jgi:hypothetical protein